MLLPFTQIVTVPVLVVDDQAKVPTTLLHLFAEAGVLTEVTTPPGIATEKTKLPLWIDSRYELPPAYHLLTMLRVPVVSEGLTHADADIAVVNRNAALSGTVTMPLVPLNDAA